MGVEATKQDAGCSIKKTPIRTCWRCASEHWAIFSLVLLLYLLRKYTPGLFAFLLSNSPVIVCTSLLLAVLICHGGAHLPEIHHQDRKAAPEQVPAGTGSSSRDVHIEGVSVPTLKKNISTEASFGARDCDNRADDLGESVPLLKHAHQGDVRLENSHISVHSLKQEAASREEYMKYIAEKESKGVFSSTDEYAKADHQGIESTDAQSGEVAEVSDHNKSVGGTPGKCKWGRAFSVRRRQKLAGIKIEAIDSAVNSPLDRSLCSPFDTFGSHDISSSGFDSDITERHSPDASMTTDTSPVLDETETGPDLLTTDDSGNHLNIMSSLDCQPPSVNNEVADNSKAKDDGEEKKDAALLWTADSEKSVMDLGYSEMERSRRLETLMVKRYSRKNIQFEPDAELPGSAPPVLHPRDDPFDFLADEQPDGSGLLPAPQNLEEPKEPVPAPHQDALFTRHESFSVGRPPQRRASRFKPSSALEEFSHGEASTSSFQRQFSDRSVSRLSVVSSECDTVSSSSVGDQDQEHNELIRSYIREVRESPGLLVGQDGGDGGDAVCAGNECSDGIGFVENETLNAVIC